MLPPPSLNSSNVRLRVVAPDALLELDHFGFGFATGFLILHVLVLPARAVEPAVRAPLERVGERVRVVHAEPGEQHLRVAVGHVVVVLVRVEEQVRRSWTTYTPPLPMQSPRRCSSPGTKSFLFAEDAVLVRVGEDREPVRPLGPRGGGSASCPRSCGGTGPVLTGFRPA